MDEVTLAELVLVGVFVYAVYRLLAPVTRRLERAILRLLDPARTDIVDVAPERDDEREPASKTKSRKRED